MKTSILKIIILIFVIFFLSVFWRALKINNNYDTKNLVGSKISNFQLNDINSGAQYISEKNLKKNKYTLINFFASWCAPCRAEHKYLLNLSNENLEIKIIGINFKDKKINATNFLEELGNPYDFVGKDIDGKVSILFGIYGIPESILVNNDLTIIKKIIGPIDQIKYNDILKLIK
jgi:cytochrome c biogenesis protein CcmG, thiol:disulfide interchange protein DsbE|tara:strand:+ start:167 stop:691 length:525 start_codon:yes stop_codon:yes gene_type:complete